MLSTKTLSNAGSTKSYFLGQDDYYLRDSAGASKSEWFGKGAKSLGLEGQVTVQDFEHLLSGLLPSGEQIGKTNDGKINHRAGFDLTFSAPKSVSILAEIGQDTRIYNAHDKAVTTALSYIEKSCSQARKTILGKIKFENTENLIAALFKHDTSRKLDPQLHTHAVIMNVTKRSDGNWRAMASDKFGYGEGTNGFIERVRTNQIYFGSIYRAVLAYELKQIGYGITKTHADGRFEITGVPREVIEHFSQRREAIEAVLKEKGWTGANAAAYITLGTRDRKENIPPELLHSVWLERSLKMEFDPKQAVKDLTQSMPTDKQVSMSVTQKALTYAIDHLSERDVLLSHHKLLNTAAQYAIGDVNLTNLMATIDKAIADKVLLPIPSKGERYYTTASLVNSEKELINSMTSNQGKANAITSNKDLLLSAAVHFNLNAEQIAAIKNIASSKDRFVVINGIAGGGKTHALNAIAAVAKHEGLKVLGLVPTQAQAKKWYKESELYVNTVSSFLSQNKKRVDVLLVDNAHLISVRQLQSLFAKAENINAKVVLAGDTKAYLPIEAGSPFAQLIKAGIKTESLQEIQRTQATKEQIQNAFMGNLDGALDKTHIIAKENKDERLQAIAEHYVTLTAKERQSTLVLLPNKKECDAVNNLIHNKLQQASGNKTAVLDIYLPKAMTRAEKSLARNYEVGNIIRFNENISNLKIKKGEYRQIKGIDEQYNKIIISDGRKVDKSISLHQLEAAEVFKHEQRAVAKGEKLQAFRSKQKVTNGDIFTIKTIRQRSLIVTTDEGNKLKLKRNDIGNLHIDYAYTMTPYRAQHLQRTTVIAHNSSEHFATNQRLFYKELSQARKNVFIYTDNQEACLAKLKAQMGDKSTALDAVFDKTISDPKEQLSLLTTQLEKVFANLNAPIDQAKEAATYAMAHLAEREAAFTHKDLLATAITYSLGDVSLEKLEKAILEVQKEGDLIRGQKMPDGTRWTTADATAIEHDLLRLAQEGQGKVSPIAIEAEKINAALENSNLRPDQRAAVSALATTQDRIILVQGYAGAGKTTMLVNFQSLANQAGFYIRGLAPSHTAAEELTTRGIKAQTLQSFLVETQKAGENPLSQKNIIYVLDEASMVSSRDMADLLKFITAQDARLIAVGDKDQLASPEAGKPFVLMQSCIKTVTLTDIQRQDPAKQELREAIQAAIHKDFAKSLSALNKQQGTPNIIELKDKEERLQMMADDYLSRASEKRANTLLITPLNADRNLVNKLVRDGLKAEGEISTNGIAFSVWLPRHLTRAEIGNAANYQPGDVVRFNRTMYTLDIAKNSYLEVVGVDAANNMLTLQSATDSKKVYWQLHSHDGDKRGATEVYRREDRELCAGDQVIWTRSDKSQNLLNGTRGNVTAVSHDQITLRLEDGSVKTLDTKSPNNLHWDHAYAVTAYAAQGKTKAEVIDHEDSTLKHLTNQRSFYVAITRAQQQVTIYTDNKPELIKRVQRNTGEKWSALEVTGKLPKAAVGAVANEYIQQQKAAIVPKVWDAKQIQQKLEERAEYVVTTLLGEPHKNLGFEWRYGAHKGSLVVTMQGQDRGLWYDFQSGEGGNLLKLIAQKYGYGQKDFAKTLEAAAGMLGLTELQKFAWSKFCSRYSALPKGAEQDSEAQKMATKEVIKPSRDEHLKHQNKKSEFSDYQKDSIKKAQKLWGESKNIKDSIAERYLRDHRGITKPLPEDLRFHPGIYSKRNNGAFPALLVACRDKDGQVQAVQATYIDPQTFNKADVEVKKQVFGVLKGSAVTLQQGNGSKSVLVCEGIETGLSLREADDRKTIKATLGVANLANVPLDGGTKNVTFCLDNDGNNQAVKRLTQNACDKLIKDGKDVFLNQPTIVHKDYNDILREQGSGAVKKMMTEGVCSRAITSNKDTSLPLETAGNREKFSHDVLHKNLDNQKQLVTKTNDSVQNLQRSNETQKLRQNIPAPLPQQNQINAAKQIIKDIERDL